MLKKIRINGLCMLLGGALLAVMLFFLPTRAAFADGAWRPYDDGVAAGITVEETEEGPGYCFAAGTFSGMYYNKPVALTDITAAKGFHITTKLQVNSLVNTGNRFLGISLMNKLTTSNFAHMASESVASGVIVYFYTRASDSKTVAQAQIMRHGDTRVQIGTGEVVIADAPVGNGTIFKVSLHKTAAGYQITYNDAIDGGCIAASYAEALFPDGTAYAATCLDYDTDGPSPVRYIVKEFGYDPPVSTTENTSVSTGADGSSGTGENTTVSTSRNTSVSMGTGTSGGTSGSTAPAVPPFAMPENGSFRPFEDVEAAGGSVKESAEGVGYDFPGPAAAGLYFDRPVNFDQVNLTMRIRVPALPIASGRYAFVSFFDTLIEDSMASINNEHNANGVMVFFYTTAEGRTVADAQVFKDGSRTTVDLAPVEIGPAPIGMDTVIKVSLKKTSGGYQLSYNDTIQSSLIRGLDDVYEDGKGYVATGLLHDAGGDSIRYILTDFAAKAADSVQTTATGASSSETEQRDVTFAWEIDEEEETKKEEKTQETGYVSVDTGENSYAGLLLLSGALLACGGLILIKKEGVKRL